MTLLVNSTLYLYTPIQTPLKENTIWDLHSLVACIKSFYPLGYLLGLIYAIDKPVYIFPQEDLCLSNLQYNKFT